MAKKTYELTPRDVLFFRDAAALEAFLKNAAARGLKILGTVPALNAARVS